MTTDRQHFKVFASNLEEALKKYENQHLDISLLEKQRIQIKTLITLENKFRKELISTPKGRDVFQLFVDYIKNEKKNILAARPFFRERQTVFTAHISNCLKSGKIAPLYKFRVNYNFIDFAIKSKDWGKNNVLHKYFKQIKELRIELMEQNMPLAISQAKIFYGNTPKSHLTWMDLVQIHAAGLLVAIDKFVPPSTKGMTNEESLQAYRKFRAVAIGRMISDRLEEYSDTMVHFYPGDRKILYRANKLVRGLFRGMDIDFEKLAEAVNKDIEIPSQRTNPEELASLLAGASTVSGDATAINEDWESIFDRYVDVKDFQESVEANDAQSAMSIAVSKLTLFEQKLLKLKGVCLHENDEQNDSPTTVSNQNDRKGSKGLFGSTRTKNHLN